MEKILAQINQNCDCEIEYDIENPNEATLKFQAFSIGLHYSTKTQRYWIFDKNKTVPKWTLYKKNKQIAKKLTNKDEYKNIMYEPNKYALTYLVLKESVLTEQVLPTLKCFYNIMYQILRCKHIKEVNQWKKLINDISKTFDCTIDGSCEYDYIILEFKHFRILVVYRDDNTKFEIYDFERYDALYNISRSDVRRAKLLAKAHEYINHKAIYKKSRYFHEYQSFFKTRTEVSVENVINIVKDFYNMIYQLLNCNHPKEIKTI